MTDLPPFLLSRDRILHGLSANDLAKRVRSGALVRVRHGVYVDGPTWRAMKPWQQYRVRVQAAGETFEKPTIFARHSSASVWDIPFIGQNHPVQALTLKNDGGRSRAGVSRHLAARAGLRVVKLEGLLVTDRVRTVLDLAAFNPFAEAIAPLDHVLRPDPARQLPALTKAELEAGIGQIYSRAAGRRIRAAIAFADPASASAGESWSRALIHVAGFEPPVLQQRFTDAAGLVGYSDFYWRTRGSLVSSTARRSTSNPSSSKAGPHPRRSWLRRTAKTGSGLWDSASSGGIGRTSLRPERWNGSLRRQVWPGVVRVPLFSTRKTSRDTPPPRRGTYLGSA